MVRHRAADNVEQEGRSRLVHANVIQGAIVFEGL